MIDISLAWFIAGFVLLIAELLSGTFFLLVLGIAAFAGGVAAWLGGGFWVQALSAAALAIVGVFWIRNRRKQGDARAMASLDVGQAVTLESWVNLPARHARVRYRDTLWDAFIQRDETATPAQIGDVFYILSTDGNTLTVARERPS